MKKTVGIVAVIITIVMLCLSLTACSLLHSMFAGLGSDTEDDGTGDVSFLTIYSDADKTDYDSYTVQYSYKNVTVMHKADHYLLGYYDQPEGGQKYFNTVGKPVKKYAKGNPTVLYAQWAEIGNMSYESKLDTEPKTSILEITIDDDYFLNAVIGNPDKMLSITLTFSCKYAPSANGGSPEIDLEFWDSRNVSHEVYGEKHLTISNKNYEDFVVNVDMRAEVFHLGEILPWAEEQHWAGSHHYYKDVKLVATFK